MKQTMFIIRPKNKRYLNYGCIFVLLMVYVAVNKKHLASTKFEKRTSWNVDIGKTFNNKSIVVNISETDFEFNFNYTTFLKSHKLDNKVFFNIPFTSRIYKKAVIFRSLSDWMFTVDLDAKAPVYLNNINVTNIKCGDIIFLKIDYVTKFFEFYHSNINVPYILITQEGDYSAGQQAHLKYLDDPKIITWFASNVNASHPKLKPIPLGFMPPRNQKFSTFYNISKNPLPYFNRTQLLYLNFSPQTNKNRASTLQYFKDAFENDTRVTINEKRISWKNYLEKIKNSQFVISPPAISGNGIDCFRTWEALVMGSVPIVMKSKLQPLYDGMPVMVVNDWSEVTNESLEQFKREKLNNLDKDGLPLRPKLWLRYWINEIMTTKEKYIQNFC